MFRLRRTMAAGYSLAEAVSLDDVQVQGAALLRPVESMFAAVSRAMRLSSPGKENRVRNGNPITVPELAGRHCTGFTASSGDVSLSFPCRRRHADFYQKLFWSVSMSNQSTSHCPGLF